MERCEYLKNISLRKCYFDSLLQDGIIGLPINFSECFLSKYNYYSKCKLKKFKSKKDNI